MPYVSTDSGDLKTGNPVTGFFGSKTETFGTPIVRCIPPRPSPAGGNRTRLTGLGYKPAATAHTLTVLGELGRTTVATDAASGATSIKVTSLPSDSSGGPPSNGDYIVIQYEDGSWDAVLISNYSALTFTVPALAQKVKADSTLYFMGAPGDWANQQITMVASTEFTFVGNEKCCLGVGTKDNSPLVVHSDNAGNAGTLRFTSFAYGAA
jgi:hypothetical protein